MNHSRPRPMRSGTKIKAFTQIKYDIRQLCVMSCAIVDGVEC